METALQRRGSHLVRRPFLERLDARHALLRLLQQAIHRKWFRDQAANAGLFQQLLSAFFIRFAGYQKQWRNNPRRLKIVVNFADQEKQHRSIDHRHLKIEDEEVVPLFQGQFEAILRLWRSIDFTTQTSSKRFAYDAKESDIVIDHQNTGYLSFLHSCTLARNSAAFQALTPKILYGGVTI